MVEIRHMHEVQRYEVKEGKQRYEVERRMVPEDGSVSWEVVMDGRVDSIRLEEGVEKRRLIRIVQKHLGVY